MAKDKLKEMLARADREGWAQWIRGDIDHRAMVEWGCYFDAAAAERVREFFRLFLRLPHPDNPSKTIPFELFDWQWERVIAPAFGWKRADGRRRFRWLWMEVAKKNGKSPLAAAILLYMLIGDGEPDPQIYGLATTRQQATIVYDEARKMVARSPALRKLIQTKAHVKRLVFPAREGFYQVIAADADGADGVNASCVVLDEVHRQRNRELFDTLVYSGAARRQPLFVALTTAGDDPESIGYELHEHAEKVNSGAIIDHEFLAYIAAADKDDAIDDPAAWRKANPSLGLTVSEDDLATAAERAKTSAAKEAAFRRFRLNQWVTNVSRWLDFDKWKACSGAVDVLAVKGLTCTAGLDLSGNNDITALELVFKCEVTQRYGVRSYFWLPEHDIAQRSKDCGVPYALWAEKGLIELTPGDYVDLDFVRKRINEINEVFPIEQLAYDPAFATQLCTQLTSDGLNVFEFYQRASMISPALRFLERLVIEQRIDHGGHPILNWMASNVEVKANADNLIKPVKPRGHAKIDGIVALAMALGFELRGDDEGDVYYTECPLI